MRLACWIDWGPRWVPRSAKQTVMGSRRDKSLAGLLARSKLKVHHLAVCKLLFGAIWSEFSRKLLSFITGLPTSNDGSLDLVGASDGETDGRDEGSVVRDGCCDGWLDGILENEGEILGAELGTPLIDG